MDEQRQVTADLDAAETEWLEASEELEQRQADLA